MINNGCFEVDESYDLATPAGIVRLGLEADRVLHGIRVSLDEIARPTCRIFSLSANYGPYSSMFVFFDTEQYTNISMSNFPFIFFGAEPGIFLCGAFLRYSSTGTVDGIVTTMTMSDYRQSGTSPQPAMVTETTQSTTGKSAVGYDAASLAQIFEVHDPQNATLRIETTVNGAGTTVTALAGECKAWIVRLRGLYDV